MKQIDKIKQAMGLLFVLAMLGGCSQEEGLNTEYEANLKMLSVTVSDMGYEPAQGMGTKAVEMAYTTTFTPNDQIGLFAVKNGQVVSTVNNLVLTAQDNLVGGLAWRTSQGKKVEYIEGATYFAYYPYRASLTGSLVPSATTASGFFLNVIGQWTVSTDQSTYQKYTANDLMVAKASLSYGTLSFPMTHCMALGVIKMPMYRYSFTNQSPSVPMHYAPLKESKFNDFKPYHAREDCYYFLTNPTQPTMSFSGSYVNYLGKKKGWEVVLNGTAGNYKFYNINQSESIGVSHTLHVGDFLLSDGTILQYTATLTAEQKVSCVGVVLKVGFDSTLDDDVYRTKDGGAALPAANIHGYVLGLNKSGSYKAWATGSFINTSVGTSGSLTDFRGYGNTQKIKAYAAANSVSFSTFPAAYAAAVEYDTEHQPAPEFTSGWFLPSMGQCRYWFNNGTRLVESVRKVLWPSYVFDYEYSSSTEFDASKYYVTDFNKSSESEAIKSYTKDWSNRVRPVLVF